MTGNIPLFLSSSCLPVRLFCHLVWFVVSAARELRSHCLVGVGKCQSMKRVSRRVGARVLAHTSFILRRSCSRVSACSTAPEEGADSFSCAAAFSASFCSCCFVAVVCVGRWVCIANRGAGRGRESCHSPPPPVLPKRKREGGKSLPAHIHTRAYGHFQHNAHRFLIPLLHERLERLHIHAQTH